MSSGPTTVLDAIVIADGYIEEAIHLLNVAERSGAPSELTSSELDDLTYAQDYLSKVMNSVIAREEA